MRHLKDRGDVALYVWDYFYISHQPGPGDDKAWGLIERATCRIRESEPYLDPPAPLDVRVRHARRVRDAARVALRNVERLSTRPAEWVIERLVELQALAESVMEALAEAARKLVLH